MTKILIYAAMMLSLGVMAGCSQQPVNTNTLQPTRNSLYNSAPAATQPAEAKASPSTAANGMVEVKLTEYKIEMPASVAAGVTTFKVTNAGKETHSFEVEGNGIEKEIEPKLQKGGTGMLQVDLKPGTYKIYCPVDGHKMLGMSLSLTVK